eukprot:scaffold187897_cov35-Tisochrysis_lutea.AAC.1
MISTGQRLRGEDGGKRSRCEDENGILKIKMHLKMEDGVEVDGERRKFKGWGQYAADYQSLRRMDEGYHS